MTTSLLESIGKLFQKFGSDREKTLLLCKIVREFDQTVVNEAQHQTVATEVFRILGRLVEQNPDEELLDLISELFFTFSDGESNTATKVICRCFMV